MGLDGKLTYIQKAARVILPAYEVLQKYGGPAGRAIKDRIMYFDSYKAQLNGIGHEGVKNMELVLGKKKFKAFKKNARVFDTERFQRYLDAFKEGGIGERQKWKKPSKEEMALYENSLKKGTQEYKNLVTVFSIIFGFIFKSKAIFIERPKLSINPLL